MRKMPFDIVAVCKWLTLAAACFALPAVAVTIEVDRSSAVGLVKPVNGVGQPPMVGALGDWTMMHYLKDAGVPYSRLHDVGGWLGGGLYVDIPNLFPDFDADETDPKNYRFAYTDDLVKALTDNGVEPFFRLGVTIENFVCRGLPAVNLTPPKDSAKWARICEHVIRHYTEGWTDGFRYKIAYWEIWNEPDNEPDAKKNPMWQGTFDEYVRFYGVVATHLKAKFPHLKIGGYGSCGFYAGVGADGVKAANSSPRTEWFVDCAKRFLTAARDNRWPLDFFSYHSYSSPDEALRQVAFADALLNDCGFTRDKTERIFNEWLPSVGHGNLGTAKQAAQIAAELIGLQNGPCDVACIYDARCGVGCYSPLFNPLTYKPHKAYDAFLAFNELRKLGTAVRCVSSDKDVYAAAACKDGKAALMVANVSARATPLLVNGLSPEARGFITDGKRTRERSGVPSVLPPQSILLLSEGRIAASVAEPSAAARRPVVAVADYLPTNGMVTVRRSMSEALLKAGLVPVVVPEMDKKSADALLATCDALVIGGGVQGQDYDRRCAFEDVLIDLADKRAMPIVGICHGAQIVNRHFGGKVEPLPKDVAKRHKDTTPLGVRTEHEAVVLPGDSLMARTFGNGKTRINSAHTRWCSKMAAGFRVTAEDGGIVEAYEHETKPIYGFQFHPEVFWEKDARCLDLLRQALAPAGAAERYDWRLGKYARIEGNLLIVDVPKGATDGAARTDIDLSQFKKGVEFHIRCRGENVTKGRECWLGTKFMLHFRNNEGVELWPGAAQKSGTFDWCEMRFAQGLGKGAKDGKGELTLGLQEASGKLVFDLSSLKVVDRADLWEVPEADKGYRCCYTDALANAPRRRGAMLPGGPCKEDDFKTLREWGATLARYQMCRNWSKDNDNRDLAEYDRWLDGKLDHLDREVLPWAEKYGIDVVVDLHVAPGGRANSDMNMFYEKHYGEHFIACWQKIARRFKGRKGIYGYDLINEPNQQFAGVGDGDYWNLQRRAAEAVRTIDPDVTIVLESNGWDSPKTFSYLRPLRMTNVIYQAHMYQPMAFTHQGVNGGKGNWKRTKYPDPEKGWNREFLRKHLGDVRKFQQAHGARIYIGEFSAIAWAEGADAYLRDVISIFEEYGWDWSYHAFREWPGWSVETECAAPGNPFKPSADNPRKRALLEGFRKAGK